MQIVQDDTHEAEAPTPPHWFWPIAETWGVNPIAAIGVIGIIVAMTDGQRATGALSMTLQTVGLAVLVPAYLLQRFRFDTSPRLALAKALVVALSVSAPLLGVWLMLLSGMMGGAVVLRRRADARS